ncbi:MAG: adenylate kinase [Clostridiales bacterium]|nr:adenylate kinase [Clostridiales bacterium]
MNIIFLGPPGSGKGTLADKVSKAVHIPAISTGALLREAVRSQSELGKQIQQYIDHGNLVPDTIMGNLIKDRLQLKDCQDGFILDGFPRTIEQAQMLDDLGICIDHVINLTISDEQIVARLTGRRVCPKCGATYHIENLPSADGKHCDVDGADLTQREDDHPETVRRRLVVYHELTEPLIAYYSDKQLLRSVDSSTDPANTMQGFLKAIDGKLDLE